MYPELGYILQTYTNIAAILFVIVKNKRNARLMLWYPSVLHDVDLVRLQRVQESRQRAQDCDALGAPVDVEMG